MRVTWRDSMMFVPWKTVNNEGMTFEEWFNAANCFDPHAVDIDTGYQAWSRGHDPTEYAARAQGPLSEPGYVGKELLMKCSLGHGDLVRPQPAHWKDVCQYVHAGWPATPPICFVVEGNIGDGVIVMLGRHGSTPWLVDAVDVDMFYDLLENSTDYQTSREGKKHVLASGLIELSAIYCRREGLFDTAAWLDEQAHQLDMHNQVGDHYDI